MTPHIDIRSSARLISWMRIFLFAASVAVVFFMGVIELVSILGEREILLSGLLVGVALAAVVLGVISRWVQTPKTLIIHLLFDMLWLSGVVYLCGGVLGPASILSYIVVILACLALPGVCPFLFSIVGSLLIVSIAILYGSGMTPYEEGGAYLTSEFTNEALLFNTTVVQVLAIFLIDVLGQVLARRVHEQHIIVGDLLSQMGDGIVLIDKRGIIRHVNDQALRLLELPADCENKRFLNVLGEPAADDDSLSTLRNVMEPGLGMRSKHVRIAKRYVLLTANDVYGRRGLAYGRMLSLRDESSLHSLEENMHRAEHLASLGEMAAGIAHEFRNPLTSMRGCAQEIADMHKKDGSSTAVAAHKLAGIIVRESDRLSNIVGDILGFSRQHSLFLQRLDVASCLQEVVEHYAHRDDVDASVRIDITMPKRCPRVFSDPEKLHQIITNLVDNGLHACAANSETVITLAVAVVQHDVLGVGKMSVCITVSDNGTGIPADQLRQVFTPFFSTRSQGTGIGLALVQRLVRALGGVIKLESDVGFGTQAHVYIPQVDSTSESGLIPVRP